MNPMKITDKFWNGSSWKVLPTEPTGQAQPDAFSGIDRGVVDESVSGGMLTQPITIELLEEGAKALLDAPEVPPPGHEDNPLIVPPDSPLLEELNMDKLNMAPSGLSKKELKALEKTRAARAQAVAHPDVHRKFFGGERAKCSDADCPVCHEEMREFSGPDPEQAQNTIDDVDE